jgi:hypothetical protein
VDKPRDQMIAIENLSDLELDELQLRYEKTRAACRDRQENDASNAKDKLQVTIQTP